MLTAPQLKVAESRLTVTGEKGYSMIRATHGNYGFILIVFQRLFIGLVEKFILSLFSIIFVS